jgi:hypothetical protein
MPGTGWAQADTTGARTDRPRSKDAYLPDSQATNPADALPQADTTGQGNKHKKRAYSLEWPRPNRAALYSLILPGLGQLYNRDYWKLPIIWGAAAAGAYAIAFNHNQFIRYRALAEDQQDALRVQYREQRDFFRRNRDLSILLTGLGYALVAVEAYVDAHMYYFDVSDDLSLAVYPSILPSARMPVPGLGLSLNLR